MRWRECYYLGTWWRTGEAIIGVGANVLKAGTIRRVRAHCRWDLDGLSKVQGVPWTWVNDEPEQDQEGKAKHLSEEGRSEWPKVQMTTKLNLKP